VKRKGCNDSDPSSNGDPSSSEDSDDNGNDDDQQRRTHKNHRGRKKMPRKCADSRPEDFSKTINNEPSKSPSHWMKPDKFDGKTSWEPSFVNLKTVLIIMGGIITTRLHILAGR